MPPRNEPLEVAPSVPGTTGLQVIVPAALDRREPEVDVGKRMGSSYGTSGQARFIATHPGPLIGGRSHIRSGSPARRAAGKIKT
jgi:hypothetical protein